MTRFLSLRFDTSEHDAVLSAGASGVCYKLSLGQADDAGNVLRQLFRACRKGVLCDRVCAPLRMCSGPVHNSAKQVPFAVKVIRNRFPFGLGTPPTVTCSQVPTSSSAVVFFARGIGATDNWSPFAFSSSGASAFSHSSSRDAVQPRANRSAARAAGRTNRRVVMPVLRERARDLRGSRTFVQMNVMTGMLSGAPCPVN